ncbi:MAG: DUF3768 domain-containing protein [Cyanobacteriota bacterium]|nr:DUF3768 domain-containing protein [Cyanobacteriota bacterium]
MSITQTTQRIAQLNDEFRKSWNAYIVITPTVQLLGSHISELLQLVRQFNVFNEDNDPYGEHDFGAIDYNGEKYFWKIDYYDQSLKYLSPDPADLTQTRRVLTLMHSSEY